MTIRIPIKSDVITWNQGDGFVEVERLEGFPVTDERDARDTILVVESGKTGVVKEFAFNYFNRVRKGKHEEPELEGWWFRSNDDIDVYVKA